MRSNEYPASVSAKGASSSELSRCLAEGVEPALLSRPILERTVGVDLESVPVDTPLD